MTFFIGVRARASAVSDDVVARFQESISDAFGWKSAIKFAFVDIGAELDRHQIRIIFPVEVSALPVVSLLSA